MWFKYLSLYRLSPDFKFDPDALEKALGEKRARPCEGQDLATCGFVAPLGKGDEAPLVHVSSGFYLIAIRKIERILPGPFIRDEVRDKVEAIEAEQMRKVYKREREQLKEDLIQQLLPRAFTKKTTTYAVIAPQLGLVIVNTASSRLAEDLLSCVREVLGSFPVRPVTVKDAPCATFTVWAKQQSASHGLTMLDSFELVDQDGEGSVIACKQQDLSSEEIQQLITSGNVVRKLQLAWEDKLSFTLDDKLVIRGLRFEDLIQEQAKQDGGSGGDELAQFDASFTLMMLTLQQFIPQLLDALGGEQVQQPV